MRSCGRGLSFLCAALLFLTLCLCGCSSDLPSADEIIDTVSDPEVTACQEWTGAQWRDAAKTQKADAAIYVTFTVIGTAQGVAGGLETQDAFAALAEALEDEQTRAGFLETAESNEAAITTYFDSAPEEAVIQDFILFELSQTLEQN